MTWSASFTGENDAAAASSRTDVSDGQVWEVDGSSSVVEDDDDSALGNDGSRGSAVSGALLLSTDTRQLR